MTARCVTCMGALKIFGSPWLRSWLLFQKFLMGFGSDRAYKCAYKIWSSWDNRGYPKKLGSPCIRPRFLFSKIFNGLLFGWTLWMYGQNLKSVAFPVQEIMGGYSQKMNSPSIRLRSLFSKIVNGLLFGWTFWMYWPNLKWVAFPVPEIIRGNRTNGSPWIRPRSLFFKNF